MFNIPNHRMCNLQTEYWKACALHPGLATDGPLSSPRMSIFVVIKSETRVFIPHCYYHARHCQFLWSLFFHKIMTSDIFKYTGPIGKSKGKHCPLTCYCVGFKQVVLGHIRKTTGANWWVKGETPSLNLLLCQVQTSSIGTHKEDNRGQLVSQRGNAVP